MMPTAGAGIVKGQPILRKPCQQRLCMIFAKDQDLPSSVVILEVTNDCQRTHHGDNQRDDVDSKAD
jgi:hypothetical protein